MDILKSKDHSKSKDHLKSQDLSLNPNSNDSFTNKNYQPVRPSSTSLFRFGSFNSKNAELIKTIEQRGDFKGSKTYHFQDLTIEVQGQVLEYDETTSKVFNLALTKYEKTHNSIIKFTLKESMDLTGLKDRKNASYQLARATKNLYAISIERDNLDSLRVKQLDYEPFTQGIRLLSSRKYERGKGYIKFTDELINALKLRTRPMIYPKIFFKLKGTAYYLLDVLLYNKQVNIRNTTARQNRVKFKTILKHCSNLPNWEEVKNREQRKRIINPIKKAIEVDLKDIISCSFIDLEGNSRQYIDNLPTVGFPDCTLVVDDWKNIINMEQLNRIKNIKKKL